MLHLKYSHPIEAIRNSQIIVPSDEEWAQELTVVAVIGSNHFNNVSDNDGVINVSQYFRRPFKFCLDLFGSTSLFSSPNTVPVPVTEPCSETENCFIDGFYNVQESILFLHLNDSYDTKLISEACTELNSVLLEKEFIPPYNSFRTKYCQSLLLLFSLSHFIILSSSSSFFETRYIHLFKTLDSIRLKTKPYISKLLSGLELPKQWIEHGRLCSPRLLFFFEMELDASTTNLKYVDTTVAPKKCLVDYEKNLEEEIYLILRKCRIITNISSNSLFEIPDSSHYVFVYDKRTPDAGCESNSLTYSNYIQQFCSSLTTKRPSSSSNAQSSSLNSSRNLFFSRSDGLFQKDFRNNFHEFLLANIKEARKKRVPETDSSRKRNEHKMIFIQPTWSQWKSAYSTLFEYLILGKSADTRAIEAYRGFQAFVNVDAEYLEAQCSKMFPKVFARYQRNVPEVYAEDEHRTRLAQAINVYLNISRGATIVSWLEKLATKCDLYWKSGHQQCPALSLQEHSCIRPIHRVPLHCHLEIVPFPFMGDSDLPELSHNTGITVKSACNCGRTQPSRDEPFTIRDANYSFYKRTECDCCEKLEEYKFPIYAASQEDSEEQISRNDMLTIIQEKCRRLTLSGAENVGNSLEGTDEDFDMIASQELRRGNSIVDEDDNEDQPDVAASKLEKVQAGAEPKSQEDLPLELDLELPPYELNEPSSLELESANDEDLTPKPAEIDILGSSNNSMLKKHFSKLEYLPGMLHSKSPQGLLPLFPSFSLVCLGSSSIYAHNTGVTHQPGFFSGFLHLLLPFDVKVKAEAGVSKPIPRRLHRGPRMFSGQMKKLTDEFSVKLFIGWEYECPFGHRFFIKSISNALMVPNNVDRIPNLKESASKIANCDIPLYYKCPCSNRETRPNVAQLMRIHIVTPKAPVNVSVNPRVQPCPPPCPVFSPGNDLPVKLRPSSYWILRLPYCYVGDDKCYVPPQDPATYNGRLLRGFYEVVAMSRLETKTWETSNTIS